MSVLQRILGRPAPPLDVLVVTKQACPLCSEALALLARQGRPLNLIVRRHDITTSPELLGVYGDEVPVVFIAGKRRFHGNVDLWVLRRLVAAERRRPAPDRQRS